MCVVMESIIVIDNDEGGSIKEIEEAKEEETNVVIIESTSESEAEETRSVASCLVCLSGRYKTSFCVTLVYQPCSLLISYNKVVSRSVE